MATHRLGTVLEYLQQSLDPPATRAAADSQLLAQFIAAQDEAAFAALLRRHGPMVLGVCRRVLRHTQDAEDAFQATFLVLARKAASVARRESVGSWLYGVAYRTAQGARRARTRRWMFERQMDELPHPEVGREDVEDLRPIVDHALSRIPEKYQAPLVLCLLEGKSRKEAARELKVPEGTVSSRLATARRLLAKRLAPYGTGLPGVGMVANGASGCVPAALFQSTAEVALLVASGSGTVAGAVSAKVAALTEGVLRTMTLTKLKTTAMVLFSVAMLGTGGAIYQARAGGPAASGVQVAADSPKADEDARTLRAQLADAQQQIAQLKIETERLRLKAEEAELRAKACQDTLRNQLGDRQKTERTNWQTNNLVLHTFCKLDMNCDGLLDKDEMPEALRAELANWDTNKDGVIDLEEYRAYVAARSQEFQHDRAQAELNDKQAKQRRQVESRRSAVLRDLAALKARKQKELADLDAQMTELKVRRPEAPTRPAPQASGSPDQSVPMRVGPAGGEGGLEFADGPSPRGARIVGVRVRHGSYIDGVGLLYKTADGKRDSLGWHGGEGGWEETFLLEEGETIIGITGTSGEYVESLTIVTNKRKSPKYGSAGSGKAYDLRQSGAEVTGFFGRSGTYVDQIGIFVRPKR
jgi:RNA polymerase sigma factor (sigma-70 family)